MIFTLFCGCRITKQQLLSFPIRKQLIANFIRLKIDIMWDINELKINHMESTIHIT